MIGMKDRLWFGSKKWRVSFLILLVSCFSTMALASSDQLEGETLEDALSVIEPLHTDEGTCSSWLGGVKDTCACLIPKCEKKEIPLPWFRCCGPEKGRGVAIRVFQCCLTNNVRSLICLNTPVNIAMNATSLSLRGVQYISTKDSSCCHDPSGIGCCDCNRDYNPNAKECCDCNHCGSVYMDPTKSSSNIGLITTTGCTAISCGICLCIACPFCPGRYLLREGLQKCPEKVCPHKEVSLPIASQPHDGLLLDGEGEEHGHPCDTLPILKNDGLKNEEPSSEILLAVEEDTKTKAQSLTCVMFGIECCKNTQPYFEDEVPPAEAFQPCVMIPGESGGIVCANREALDRFNNDCNCGVFWFPSAEKTE